MKRKAAKAKTITTHNQRRRPKFDAATMYTALERRVAALESQIAQPQAEGWDDGADTVRPTEEKVKRGPKSKFRSEDFTLWRDLLVDMLESHWPEIEPHCVPVVKAAGFRIALKAIAQKGGSQHQHCANHLLRNSETLLKFVGKSRFRGDPRQIANALAGVPKLGFWRSLKLGQAEPCRELIGQRALKAYIRRKHRGLYDELEEKIDLVHFINVWRAYRKQDDNIRDYYPRAIHHAWIVAKPQWE
jgi:hypothetical protein